MQKKNAKKILLELEKYMTELEELNLQEQKKEDGYIQSYPHFIKFFKERKEIDKAAFFVGVHMVYGWMPTIPKIKFNETPISDVISILNLAKKGKNLNKESFIILAKFINGSMVGTSKLLHFICPKKYPIWDSKIYSYFFQQKSSHHRVSKVDHYINYMQVLNQIIEEPAFKYLHKRINKNIFHYNATAMRAVEYVIFQAANKKSK